MQCTSNLKWHEAAISWQCHICLQTPWSGPSSLICQAERVAKCFWFFNSSRVGWRLENDCVSAWPDPAHDQNHMQFISAMSWRASAQYFASIWLGGLEDLYYLCDVAPHARELERCLGLFDLFAQNKSTRSYPSSPFWALRPCSVRGMWQRGGSYPNHQVLRCAPQWHHWIAHGMQPDAYQYYIQYILYIYLYIIYRYGHNKLYVLPKSTVSQVIPRKSDTPRKQAKWFRYKRGWEQDWQNPSRMGGISILHFDWESKIIIELEMNSEDPKRSMKAPLLLGVAGQHIWIRTQVMTITWTWLGYLGRWSENMKRRIYVPTEI